jgi:hypothetical protein
MLNFNAASDVIGSRRVAAAACSSRIHLAGIGATVLRHATIQPAFSRAGTKSPTQRLNPDLNLFAE